MLLITFLLIFVVVLFLYKLFSPCEKIRKYGDKIPGPKALPILGNALCFITKKPVLQLLYDFSSIYGPVFRLWVGKQLFVVLYDPADVEVFLSSSTKHLDKSDSYRFLDSWLGKTNLLTSDGNIWQIHRKLLTPSFHFKILENSVSLITRNVELLCDQLEKSLVQPDVEIEEYVEKFSLDVICEMAMGTKLETQLSKNSTYLDCIKTLTKMVVKRATSPWLHPEMIFRLTSIGDSYLTAFLSAKEFVTKVIMQRKMTIEENSKQLIPEQEGRKVSQPFLDFLLTRSNFSNAEIENEVQTFMFAGHDTTKTTISFCLYVLSQNQEAQDKAVIELKETLLGNEKEFTYQDFTNLKYLENVIKETMRLYATVPLISRKVSEDVKLPSGYVLPAGALVNLFIFFMHRNGHVFPDPEDFQPERFERRENNRNPYSYIPFSGGPRNCIGQKFAMLEMKITLSLLLLKYQFLPVSDTEPLILETSLVIRSLNGLRVRIKRRNIDNIE